MHLYGDVYSSPGLDLRQKQLLACSFLGVACMPDQLFGHALAVNGMLGQLVGCILGTCGSWLHNWASCRLLVLLASTLL